MFIPRKVPPCASPRRGPRLEGNLASLLGFVEQIRHFAHQRGLKPLTLEESAPLAGIWLGGDRDVLFGHDVYRWAARRGRRHSEGGYMVYLDPKENAFVVVYVDDAGTSPSWESWRVTDDGRAALVVSEGEWRIYRRADFPILA
jgi:hypothetical protein